MLAVSPIMVAESKLATTDATLDTVAGRLPVLSPRTGSPAVSRTGRSLLGLPEPGMPDERADRSLCFSLRQ